MINDYVHSSLLVVFQKKIVQSVVTTIGSIVETQTPSHRLRYDGDIGFQTSITGRGVALVMGPPTVWVTARIVDTGPIARWGTVGNIVWQLGVDSGVDARKKLLGFCVSGKDGSSLPNSRERGCNLGHGGITVGCTFGRDVYGIIVVSHRSGIRLYQPTCTNSGTSFIGDSSTVQHGTANVSSTNLVATTSGMGEGGPDCQGKEGSSGGRNHFACVIKRRERLLLFLEVKSGKGKTR